MANEPHKGRLVIHQQLGELDHIFRETMETLNTVAGMERVAKWRTKTIALLTDALGKQAGDAFARVQPGPSFTNDLVEEFTDFIETFRTPLTTLAKTLPATDVPPSTGG